MCYESRLACVLHISTCFFFFTVVLKYITSVCVVYVNSLLRLPPRYLIASNHILGPSQYIPFAHGVVDTFIRGAFSKRYIGVLSLQQIYTGCFTIR